MSSIVSDEYEFVIGVDTHAATHSFAVVAAATGAVVAHEVFPTSAGGRSGAQSWMARRTAGAATLVVVEGTGSFGAILTEQLAAAGQAVVEAARMPAGDRRGKGKSDELDAVRIARAVLGSAIEDLRIPRTLGADRARVAMRVLVVAREQMTAERTRAINALSALVRTIDLGVDARRPRRTRRTPPALFGAHGLELRRCREAGEVDLSPSELARLSHAAYPGPRNSPTGARNRVSAQGKQTLRRRRAVDGRYRSCLQVAQGLDAQYRRLIVRVTVRPYQLGDASTLSLVMWRSVSEAALTDYTPQQTEAWLPNELGRDYMETWAADGRRVLVAVDETGQIIGYIDGYIDLEPNGHIDHLFCVPEAVGQGVAAALYSELEKTARSAGITVVRVEASEAARRFFEKQGFEHGARHELELSGVRIHNYEMFKLLSHLNS
jgi:GNAT superfamily N-acetyltransferase